jgi:hypothetical protein
MEPVTSQRVSTKRIQTKLNKHMLDLSQQPPLNQRNRHWLTEKKKGDKKPVIAPNKYNVLEDILDGSSMDYDDLDNPGHGPS